jgi:hypothetical protein
MGRHADRRNRGAPPRLPASGGPRLSEPRRRTPARDRQFWRVSYRHFGAMPHVVMHAHSGTLLPSSRTPEPSVLFAWRASDARADRSKPSLHRRLVLPRVSSSPPGRAPTRCRRPAGGTSGSRCCRTVFQCGRAGNSIAIVGMARRHGVAPEGAHTAPGRTLPHLHDPGACGARGRSRQGKTAVPEHALAHAPGPTAWLTCTPLERDPGQLLGSARRCMQTAVQGVTERARSFRPRRPKPCGTPSPFAGRGWRDD